MGVVTIAGSDSRCTAVGEERVSAGSPVDVNGDGVVSILDLIRVSQEIAGSPAAPLAGTQSVDGCDDRGVDCTGTVGR